jgi:two-component system, OmpR family, phosphate regulon response regulator PhoB
MEDMALPSPAAPPDSAAATDGAVRSLRILIIERDAESAAILHDRLSLAGYAVTTLTQCEEALAAVEHSDPHLVVLDWDLPGVITMELIRHVGTRTARDRATRVMALSTYAGEQRVVAGLEQGLDDYVVKPYSLKEMLARVRAMLRPMRTAEDHSTRLKFHGMCMDLDDNRLTVQGRRVHLRSAEFRLLEFLMRHPERAFDRAQLLNLVWGRESSTEARAVDVTIQRIRKALLPHQCEQYLQTVRGVGYRLSAAGTLQR